MNYINWKVNIQNIQNFLQVLYWSLKVTNAPKLISMYLIDNIQNQTISELYTDDKKIQNILAMCFVPSISLTVRYLALKQKSHLSYIKRMIKKTLQTIELFHHF